jgi:hypothetical protein
VPLLLSVTFTGSHKSTSFQDYIINFGHKKLSDTGPGTVRADVLTYLGYLGFLGYLGYLGQGPMLKNI